MKKILAFIVGRKFSKLIVYNVSGIAAVAELELQMESEQHTAIYREGMAKGEGMMTFLYTEVEGRVDAFHNGRHKD